MEKYIGVKIIQAEPITRGEYNKFKGWTIPPDENPDDDGYMVKYSDDYISWSPKDVFEEAYRKTDGMTFGLAVEALKKGFKVCRKGWNGKGQFIELATNVSYITPNGDICNVNHEQMGNKAIAFVGTSGVQLGWLASQADMLSEDWQIVD
jgi:hypothetical protein